MDLEEVFGQLFHGELSQTGIGPTLTNTSALLAINYPKIINFINLGVLALHTRFLLIEQEVVIQLYEGTTSYDLIWGRAFTNSEATLSPLYITDSIANPFNQNRLIKILSVYDELGNEFILNPSTFDPINIVPNIAYTPQQLVLQIPAINSENAVAAMCQAAPNKIATTVTDTSTVVELPDVLLECLLLFIAERYFSGMNAQKEESVVYPNKYEEACDAIEARNMINTVTNTGQDKYNREGWV